MTRRASPEALTRLLWAQIEGDVRTLRWAYADIVPVISLPPSQLRRLIDAGLVYVLPMRGLRVLRLTDDRRRMVEDRPYATR